MENKGKTWMIVVVVVLILALIGACSGGGSSTPACGHASCAENGPFYCMGKNDTCPNKTYCAYDYYCSQCD